MVESGEHGHGRVADREQSYVRQDVDEVAHHGERQQGVIDGVRPELLARSHEERHKNEPAQEYVQAEPGHGDTEHRLARQKEHSPDDHEPAHLGDGLRPAA